MAHRQTGSIFGAGQKESVVRCYHISPAGASHDSSAAGRKLAVQQRKSVAKTSYDRFARTEFTCALAEGTACITTLSPQHTQQDVLVPSVGLCQNFQGFA